MCWYISWNVSLSILERRGTLVHKTNKDHNEEKLYSFYIRSRHLFTISLKNSHLFKIAESVISFYLKKFSDLTILNMWKSFNEIVYHITCPP